MFSFPEACWGGANRYRGGESWNLGQIDTGGGSWNLLLFFLMTLLICLIESLFGSKVGWALEGVACTQSYSGRC